MVYIGNVTLKENNSSSASNDYCAYSALYKCFRQLTLQLRPSHGNRACEAAVTQALPSCGKGTFHVSLFYTAGNYGKSVQQYSTAVLYCRR